MPNSDPILLRSRQLSVEIAAPGALYHRTRFDWNGFITQVHLGEHTFCVPEGYPPHEGTAGVGICNEYGNEKTIGYHEAKPGEPFPKPGIGLITRPDPGEYNFFRDHDIVQIFPVTVETGDNWVRFSVDPVECNGYAIREIKTIRAEENCLSISTTFQNAGVKPIHTHEYTHNFIGIDGHPVGPGYRLRFPYPLRFENMTGGFRRMLPAWLQPVTPNFVLEWIVRRNLSLDVLQVKDGEIRWKSTPQKAFFCRPLGFSATDRPQWELVHEPTGVGVREVDDFPPARVALWGAAHVISAEVYIDIDLEPGQSQTWTRQYEFFC